MHSQVKINTKNDTCVLMRKVTHYEKAAQVEKKLVCFIRAHSAKKILRRLD